MVQKRMGRIDVTATSTAPPEAVWRLVADVTTWHRWGRHDESELERPGPGDPAGVGAIRRFRLGRYVSREEVVAFETERHLGYRLLSGLPLYEYRADVTLAPAAEGTTIRWVSTFRPKVPGTRRVFERRLGSFIQDTANLLARAAANTPADGRAQRP